MSLRTLLLGGTAVVRVGPTGHGAGRIRHGARPTVMSGGLPATTISDALAGRRSLAPSWRLPLRNTLAD